MLQETEAILGRIKDEGTTVASALGAASILAVRSQQPLLPTPPPPPAHPSSWLLCCSRVTRPLPACSPFPLLPRRLTYAPVVSL